MVEYVEYKGFVIEWIDYMDAFRVYAKDRPQWTIAYDDSSIEDIKNKLDKFF